MQGSGGLEPPEPGGDDEDSVRSVTDSEQSEEEKAKWSKKDCVHSQSHIVLQHDIVPMFHFQSVYVL